MQVEKDSGDLYDESICQVDDTYLEESTASKRCPSESFNKSVVNSIIILDSFEDVAVNKKLITSHLVHDLGKGYRTPPFSPLLNEEGLRRGQTSNNRNASTPLSSIGISPYRKDLKFISKELSGEVKHSAERAVLDFSDGDQRSKKHFVFDFLCGCSRHTCTLLSQIN